MNYQQVVSTPAVATVQPVNHTSPPQPRVLKLALDVHLTPIANAVGYEVQTCPDGTNWTTVKFSTQARTIALTGLTTGTKPQVRARALGGSTDASQWSLPVSCTVH